MVAFRVGRRRPAQHLEVHDAELVKRAGRALVAADERIRAAADEVGFAEAELGAGAGATTQLNEVLGVVRRHLRDGFRMNRLNHDVFPGSADEVRARYLLIVELCELVEDELNEQTSALAERMRRARHAPDIIAGVRADTQRLRDCIPHARETIDHLAARYAREALVHVEGNVAEADQLLGFAEHSVGVAERRREAGHREQASVALEASVESVRRAATLLDAVETFEVEALRAESTLAALVEVSRRDLAAALEEPRSRRVADLMGELQAALAALPPAGVNTDPFAHLSRLREARAALEAAITAARERATDLIPLVHHVHHAIKDADRKLDAARDAIAAHPGWIGADAQTRLAESERIRIDLGHSLGSSAATTTVTDQDHREQLIAMARRVTSLASEALELARRDIDASRSQRRLRPRLVPSASPGDPALLS